MFDSYDCVYPVASPHAYYSLLCADFSFVCTSPAYYILLPAYILRQVHPMHPFSAPTPLRACASRYHEDHLGTNAALLADAVSDMLFTCGIRRAARALAKTGHKVFATQTDMHIVLHMSNALCTLTHTHTHTHTHACARSPWRDVVPV